MCQCLQQTKCGQDFLDMNRETAPYQIIDGAAENVDLIAEWKIVDAKWHELFAKANLTKVFAFT